MMQENGFFAVDFYCEVFVWGQCSCFPPPDPLFSQIYAFNLALWRSSFFPRTRVCKNTIFKRAFGKKTGTPYFFHARFIFPFFQTRT